MGVAIGIAAPRIRTITSSFAVDAAAREITAIFAQARLVSLRDRGAEIRIDSTGVSLFARGRIIRDRRIAEDHGVRLRTTVPLVRYAATGIAIGLSNGSLYLSRDAAADTIVISRLGRVRR
jgi:hypothetical protein